MAWMMLGGSQGVEEGKVMVNTFCLLRGPFDPMFQYCKDMVFVRSVLTWTRERGHERFDHHYVDMGETAPAYDSQPFPIVRILEYVDTEVS